MYKISIYLSLVLSLCFHGCTKEKSDDLNLDPETEALVSILQEEMAPLGSDPLAWQDEELRWLDPLAVKSVIGLGEATHGTAEFFDAKHRIFRFLVENHGYKIFAFEADFGESLFINDAIQEGRTEDIQELMTSKMHFWTWKTQEVKDLLEWMSEYNQGKDDEEKIHYMGVDCQFNTYHPKMARDYLSAAGIPFQSYADSILQVAETESAANFDSFDSNSFTTYLGKLHALQDSLLAYKEILVSASSEKEFQLQLRIIEVIRQVSVVRNHTGSTQMMMDSRDKYMAHNTAWLLDYFENEKVVVWAHNYHVSDFDSGNIGTMGYYLRYLMGYQYAIIGFLFSQGTFTAAEMDGEEVTGFGEQELDTPPQENSLNALMSYTREPAFSVEVEALRNYLAWYSAFDAGMNYFFMGSAYNNHPEDYYISFYPDLYDYLIYFDKSNASEMLQSK